MLLARILAAAKARAARAFLPTPSRDFFSYWGVGGIPPAEPSQFRSDIFKQTPKPFLKYGEFAKKSSGARSRLLKQQVMNFRSGFTLVELLVVIAMFGITTLFYGQLRRSRGEASQPGLTKESDRSITV